MRFGLGLLLGAAALLPMALAAQERFEGRAYVIACGEEGCFLNAAGLDMFVPLGQGSDLVADMPMMAAVDITGTLSDIGDATADLALASARRASDDLYEGNLVALQGDWRPVGEETPFHVGIYGMDWSEVVQDETADSYMMSVGDACADGTVHRGMVINLYRYGDEPGADACWLVEYVDDARLTLRDLDGGGGVVDWDRITAP